MNLPQLRVLNFAVIRGFMPLGVAQIDYSEVQYLNNDGDSWLYAVRRCSNIEVKLLTAIAEAIRSLIRLGYSFLFDVFTDKQVYYREYA